MTDAVDEERGELPLPWRQGAPTRLVAPFRTEPPTGVWNRALDLSFGR